MKSLLHKFIGKSNANQGLVDLLWLDDLDNTDVLTAIANSTEKLKLYFSDGSIKESERLRVLITIDQENRARLHKINRQFIDVQNMRPELETRISDTVYFYHRQIFLSYRRLSNRFFETTDDVIFAYDRIPLVLGRTLNAAYSMAKWRYYNQQPTAGMAWWDIFAIYKLLEQEGQLDITIPLYRDDLGSHLGATFVQACMLDSLAQSGFKKSQIVVIQQILEKWIPLTNITRNYDEKRHLFYIDLNKDQGARRIRLFEPNPDCRYWDTDELTKKIQSTIEAIDKGLAHDLEGLTDKPKLIEILTVLRSEWSRDSYKRQRRTEDRQKVIKSATVIYGLDEIAARLKKSSQLKIKPDESTLDDRLVNHSVMKTAPTILYEDLVKERWMIIDESTNGYGVVASEELPDSVKLEKLVGMMIDDQRQNYVIGSIRSIKKLANGQHQIGIKVISKQPQWVQLSHADLKLEKQNTSIEIGRNNGMNSHNMRDFSGIYLPIEPGFSNSPSLVMPRIEFIENGIYQVSIQNNKSVIQLESTIDKKDDWVRVSYPA